MALKVAGRTDTGTVRPTNQDAIDWCVDDAGEQALIIIADGMGGYQGGEVASQIAVETLMERLAPSVGQSLSETEQQEKIQAALSLASERIDACKTDNPELEKMGTTVVMAWICGGQGLVAHLGDSRCYQLKKGELNCLTRDDTVVQNMLEDGSIREEEVPNVPFRNVLTRALGSSAATATFGRVELSEGDQLLMCSDGLTDALDEDAWLPHLAASESLDSRVQSLLAASLEQGARDNVSIVLLSAE